MALILVLHNVSTLPSKFCDYEVSVRINEREIATGFVHRHRREDGWAILVAKFLKENCPEAMEAVRPSMRRSIGGKRKAAVDVGEA